MRRAGRRARRQRYTHAPPGDPGLQSERTILAWQRTTLSLAVVLVIGARLEVGRHGGWATVALLVAAAAPLALTLPVRTRRLAVASSRESGFPVMLRDGTAPFLLAGLLALLCLVKLVDVVSGWTGGGVLW